MSVVRSGGWRKLILRKFREGVRSLFQSSAHAFQPRAMRSAARAAPPHAGCPAAPPAVVHRFHRLRRRLRRQQLAPQVRRRPRGEALIRIGPAPILPLGCKRSAAEPGATSARVRASRRACIEICACLLYPVCEAGGKLFWNGLGSCPFRCYVQRRSLALSRQPCRCGSNLALVTARGCSGFARHQAPARLLFMHCGGDWRSGLRQVEAAP